MRQATINWCDSISELTWPFCDRTDNIIVDETMPYYSKNKLRLTPEADNLQALFAEAEILAGGGAAQQAQGQPKMLELIDSIMSIPSCLQVWGKITAFALNIYLLTRINSPRLRLSTSGSKNTRSMKVLTGLKMERRKVIM